MKFRAISDDREIINLAKQDGCAMRLRLLLAKMDGTQYTVITHRRVYLVHAVHGDSGYSCFEVANPLDMPVLLDALAPTIGPIDSMTLGRHDNDPAQAAREVKH